MRRIAAIVVVMIGAAWLAACGTPGGGGGPVTIVSATWSQSQAIEGFDSEPGEMTDTAELARLADILNTYDLQNRDIAIGEECPGGRTTKISYVTDTGESHNLGVAGCDRGDMGEAIDALVSQWRTNR